MDCDVIRDLLPLYADGLTGEASNAAIEEHLKTCPECKRLKEQMCAPMEPEPVDEEKAYMEIIRAQKRKARRRTIRTCVLTALACILCWWIYMETHFYGEEIALVSNDGDEILAEIPELALTDAELALADTILEVDAFRDAFSPDYSVFTELDTEAVREYIEPILPEGAQILAVTVYGYNINIDYRVGSMRTMLEYSDKDQTGHVDTVFKLMADSPYEVVNGVEFAGDVDTVYTITQAVGTGLTRYEKTESRHMWFSFLDMP